MGRFWQLGPLGISRFSPIFDEQRDRHPQRGNTKHINYEAEGCQWVSEFTRYCCRDHAGDGPNDTAGIICRTILALGSLRLSSNPIPLVQHRSLEG